MEHFFTVDVEEYFQVSAFEGTVVAADWGRFESRLRIGLDSLLELLESHRAKATFFVLGWIGERHPGAVRDIVGSGHEVASHGQNHERVTRSTPEEFRADVRRSRAVLEDLTGSPVVGFRAPSFSIVPGLEWALDVLLEEGYRYDSSLFPVARRGYGYPGGQTVPHWLERELGRLYEVPPLTVRRLGYDLPAAGGGYFRLFTYGLVRSAFAQAERDGRPGTFYIHPWELDARQPRLPVGSVTRFRHYVGLSRTRARVDRLLTEFRFTSIAARLPEEIAAGVNRT